jgi:hypothetical protein
MFFSVLRKLLLVQDYSVVQPLSDPYIFFCEYVSITRLAPDGICTCLWMYDIEIISYLYQQVVKVLCHSIIMYMLIFQWVCEEHTYFRR